MAAPSAEVPNFDVQHGDSRLLAQDSGQHFETVARLGHDLDIRFHPEHEDERLR